MRSSIDAKPRVDEATSGFKAEMDMWWVRVRLGVVAATGTGVAVVSVSHLATVLDLEMLCSVGLVPHPFMTPIEALPEYAGREIAARTGFRHLLRYVRRSQAGSFINGSTREHFVTPTPYPTEDVCSYLALPAPLDRPHHVLLLETVALLRIRGPRMTRLGAGVEFILPTGFPKGAVVPPGWEVELR